MKVITGQQIDLSSQSQPAEDWRDAIGVGEKLPASEVIRLVYETPLKHVVQKDSRFFEEELRCAEEMLKNPHLFMNKPLEVILGAEDPNQPHISLSVSSASNEKKGKTLELLDKFLLTVAGSTTIREQARAAADELYTNSAKHALVHVEKGKSSDLGTAGQIEFFARANRTRLVIGCSDSFGDLEIHHVMKKIHGVFNQGISQSINHGPGGSGIGSFMIYSSAIGYYAGVKRGHKSIVCVAFPLSVGARGIPDLPKNIHLVTVE